MAVLMTTAKKRVSLYLDDRLKKELERLAKRRKRSLNSLIEVCMEEIAERSKKDGEI